MSTTLTSNTEQAISLFNSSHYVTATFQTEDKHSYTVIKRRSFVVAVRDDGKVAEGNHVWVDVNNVLIISKIDPTTFTTKRILTNAGVIHAFILEN